MVDMVMMAMMVMVVMVMPVMMIMAPMDTMPNRNLLDRRGGGNHGRDDSRVCGDRSQSKPRHYCDGQGENRTMHLATPARR